VPLYSSLCCESLLCGGVFVCVCAWISRFVRWRFMCWEMLSLSLIVGEFDGIAGLLNRLYWWLSRKVSRAWPDLGVRFVLLCAFIAFLGYGGGHKCAAEKIKFFRRRRNYVPGLKISMVHKEEVSFVALTEGVILVKFGAIDDRTRILNLSPWLFDWCLFALLPFAIGEVLAIDWRDRDGVIKNDVDECGS
ncbi:hypothetical protein Gotri_014578, partial [Gossypium trilobum]|nr:hypothetical protein [Gossypium trilobum]